jgi:hypothetical protein
MDGMAFDFEQNNTNVSVRRCYMHDNTHAPVQLMADLSNVSCTISDNVTDHNGTGYENSLTAAFINTGKETTNSGSITNNYIRKLDVGQYTSYISGPTESWPANFTVSDNHIYAHNAALPFPKPSTVSGTKISQDATATASSAQTNCPASRVKDGIYGQNNGSGEWATISADTQKWVKLTWASPQTIRIIRLFDRRGNEHVGTNSWVQQGVLTFSDGTTIRVNAGIRNDGAPREIVLPHPLTSITWVKFQATRYTGTNIGLAEFEVYK